MIALVFFIAAHAQIKVISDGSIELVQNLIVSSPSANVGQIYPNVHGSGFIGKSNKRFYQIHSDKILGSTFYCDGTPFQSSDLKLKENIKEIENALQTILQLNGKKYDFKIDSTDLSGNKEDVERNIALKKNKFGFIAQDVQKILPEVTHFNEENNKLYLDYTAFIPIIVEAFKEQQNQIIDLKKEVEQLKNNSPATKSATIENTTSTKENLFANNTTLAQNIPNPFTDNTRIGITLPEMVKNARLYVYNMQGAQIKSFDIIERGATSVTIEGYTLQAGMYLYTLIVDGKEVDTKKMILTK